MSKTHLETAHEYGVKQALKAHGYASVEDLEKEAATLGLFEGQKTAAPTDPLDHVFRAIDSKLR